MTIPDVQIVTAAFRLAVQQLDDHPECQALFDELEIDGVAALRATVYSRAHRRAEQILCSRGALAVTNARATEIRLCPNFKNLSRKGMAVILLHEALHTAGLGEWPVDPQGPTSAEITRAVLKACALD